jgi:hypothetical protein
MTDKEKDTVKSVFFTDLEALLKICKDQKFTTLQSLAHIAEHVAKSDIEFLFWLSRVSYFDLFSEIDPDKFLVVVENYYTSWKLLPNP